MKNAGKYINIKNFKNYAMQKKTLMNRMFHHPELRKCFLKRMLGESRRTNALYLHYFLTIRRKNSLTFMKKPLISFLVNNANYLHSWSFFLRHFYVTFAMFQKIVPKKKKKKTHKFDLFSR